LPKAWLRASASPPPKALRRAPKDLNQAKPVAEPLSGAKRELMAAIVKLAEVFSTMAGSRCGGIR
jgi:hypothetical protein